MWVRSSRAVATVSRIGLFAATMWAQVACGSGGGSVRDFTLPDHAGQQVHFAEQAEGRGVVLFFFTTWCESCARQVGPLGEFAAATADDDIVVMAISIQEEADTIADYVAARAPGYPVLRDATGEVSALYGVEGIPTIVGLDASGREVFREHVMPDDPATLVARLSS